VDRVDKRRQHVSVGVLPVLFEYQAQ
jgi:hypothetical protein